MMNYPEIKPGQKWRRKRGGKIATVNGRPGIVVRLSWPKHYDTLWTVAEFLEAFTLVEEESS